MWGFHRIDKNRFKKIASQRQNSCQPTRHNFWRPFCVWRFFSFGFFFIDNIFFLPLTVISACFRQPLGCHSVALWHTDGWCCRRWRRSRRQSTTSTRNDSLFVYLWSHFNILAFNRLVDDMKKCFPFFSRLACVRHTKKMRDSSVQCQNIDKNSTSAVWPNRNSDVAYTISQMRQNGHSAETKRNE